ncbi:TraR/DksA family transcriptional regulator [Arthrobacter sp. zg-Y820]|uniref:TraR/DksA family transcriptional regulator n=1 Tax=unclassified Arthrobacter TaxID=235627 RepID=UPI001E304120|nr:MULTISPECIES: TraR/DksA family transcriptional regulator [unclassified Arthrobacter]MCC9198075.1 TraR/DksA family transcriptional regulator [Arthrobacter sp. zg-Y820]MDK1280942.1 TraR/DksA family transcriptional regulator [Arthrobacter sp. zg.Y820]WIB10416.1 TraR/DksA family transcriptional regulator [Arthrobacter sp. zg-Y820]
MTRKVTAAPRKPSAAADTRTPAPQHATPADLDTAHFAQLLDERMAEAREKIDAVLADIREVTLAAKDTPADDEHDPEGSTVSVERNNEMALLAAAEASLIELLDARVRLDKGTYGVCENCGNPIPAERLDIRPEARFCVSCAAAARRR